MAVVTHIERKFEVVCPYCGKKHTAIVHVPYYDD